MEPIIGQQPKQLTFLEKLKAQKAQADKESKHFEEMIKKIEGNKEVQDILNKLFP